MSTGTNLASINDDGSDPHGWREEGRDLLRAVAAGSIVGMPLLYTMEMWWRGMAVSEWHLLALLGASLLINFAFCLVSGFRPRYSPGEAASEATTAVALGMLYSAAVLWLVGEITFQERWSEVLGRVLVETAPVSLGISFANYQMNKSRDGDDDEAENGGDDAAGNGRSEAASASGRPDDPERLQRQQDLTDLAATVGGATLFAYNIAPTEEILVIAARLAAWQLLVLMAVSLLLCYTILFAAGFKERRIHVPGPFQSPVAETAMAYAASLLVSFMLLAMVGVPEATGTPSAAVAMTVVLGLPAVVGASAGRLIV